MSFENAKGGSTGKGGIAGRRDRKLGQHSAAFLRRPIGVGLASAV